MNPDLIEIIWFDLIFLWLVIHKTHKKSKPDESFQNSLPENKSNWIKLWLYCSLKQRAFAYLRCQQNFFLKTWLENVLTSSVLTPIFCVLFPLESRSIQITFVIRGYLDLNLIISDLFREWTTRRQNVCHCYDNMNDNICSLCNFVSCVWFRERYKDYDAAWKEHGLLKSIQRLMRCFSNRQAWFKYLLAFY